MVCFPPISPPEPCTPLSLPPYVPHVILLDFTSRTIFHKEYRSLSSSLCNFLHFFVTWSPLGPNTLLNTLFSNTLSLRSSLNVSDHVSHPYRTTNRKRLPNLISLLVLALFFQCFTSESTRCASIIKSNRRTLLSYCLFVLIFARIT